MFAANPSGIIFATKECPAYWLGTDWKESISKSTALLVRHGVATATYAAMVRREALRAQNRVRFLGGLDPEDLSIFLSLAYGNYRMRPRRRSAVPI